MSAPPCFQVYFLKSLLATLFPIQHIIALYRLCPIFEIWQGDQEKNGLILILCYNRLESKKTKSYEE